MLLVRNLRISVNVNFTINQGENYLFTSSENINIANNYLMAIKLLRPEGRGKVYLNNDLIFSESDYRIAYIDKNNTLLPHLNIKDNIFANTLYRNHNEKEFIKENLKESMSITKIKNIIMEEKPVSKLSIFERQKVCLVRSLILNPSVIIICEPLLFLNDEEEEEFKKILLYIKRKKITVLMSSNRINIIKEYFDYIISIDNEKIDYLLTPNKK